jgi:hypothetical protein
MNRPATRNFLVRLSFDLEYVGNAFLRNVALNKIYTALYHRRLHHNYHCENLKSYILRLKSHRICYRNKQTNSAQANYTGRDQRS